MTTLPAQIVWIAGWLGQARGWLDQNPDLALLLFAIGVVVFGIKVIGKSPRWK